MPLSNTKTRYGAVAKWFHWLTALLVLTLIPLGIVARDLPYATSEELQFKALLFSIHKTLGITVFFLALIRIFWALSQPHPGLLNAANRAEAFLARTVHWLLYSSLLLVPITGWIHHAATEGFAPIRWPFGQDLPFVPTNDSWVAHLFSSLHFTFERVLAFSAVLHILGALKHHFIDRDATLRRMLPGRPAVPSLPNQGHSRVTVVAAAFGVHIAALAIGTFVWYLPGIEKGASAPALDTVGAPAEPGNWFVTDGAITISVTQLGSEVPGEFGAWTSQIEFDETVSGGVAGTVTAEIGVASLSLGALTEQALGPDFLDAGIWPMAAFQAELIVEGNEYVADGDLTLRGVTLPLRMPFSLEIDGDEARANSRFALMRLDYGVGRNMPGGDSLGLEVAVGIDLSARRGPE